MSYNSTTTCTTLSYFTPIHATEAALIGDPKVVVSIPQLMQLAPRVCVVTDCSELVTVRNEYKGCGVLVHMNCSAGHRYTWSSSPQHVDSRGRAIYSNNLLLSCASGNSFSKLRLMFKFMGLKFITSTMHCRYVLFAALHVSIIIYAIKLCVDIAFVIPPIKT